MLKMHHPVIEGREQEELFWGTSEGLSKRAGAVALPVNSNDGCDLIVLRYRFSFLDRLKILLGQHLFVWLPTFGNRPQWPQLHLTNPQELANGNVLPYDPELFYAENKRGLESGELVPTTAADGSPSAAMNAGAEFEMSKTVKLKLLERRLGKP